MVKTKRLIFKMNDLKKDYGQNNILKVKKLEIHPGTIYGIVGTIGSGKTTLLNLLAGHDKESSGTLLYDGNSYKKNWLGNIKKNDNIFSTNDPIHNGIGKTIANYISYKFPKKKNLIENRYFKKSRFKNLLSRKINDISPGELNWLGMILACECDPRVLLIDDYGIYFNASMEQEFRNQVIKMNRSLGTTVILAAPSEIYLKHFVSVLIFLDHGHISRIRTGYSKNSKKDQGRKKYNTKKHKRNNKR
ncbi:MAG: hypothetical protein CMG55_09445 [Candidatus Marinimicrobia bacterium]|nr:hypothetical protein [Candidatus Neomarinimicrobiota bacterium]|tara:strand:- start:1513 stop:2253 length:741 start_codon:yes stop_codon:yes gene_type:complete